VKSALTISDKAVALEQGLVAIEGPAQAVLNDPRIGALFLGGHAAAARQKIRFRR